jgi:CPA2 family monovalent cation:H+ antiporter-2
LAEIGVMLMMFGVGLHFSIDDLWDVRKIALPGAILQIAVATALGMGLAHWWGWSLGGGLVFGLALSVASTVVLLRAGRTGILDSLNGRIAVGWLVVEDLVTVLVLVLLPALAGAGRQGRRRRQEVSLWHTLAITLGQVAGFIVFMLVVGRKLFPWILWQVARTGSRELFTLCVIAAAVGIAYADQAVRRVLRAGRLLRRHGAARIRTQPPRRGRIAAAARRLRGAVLRLGRHAVRADILIDSR